MGMPITIEVMDGNVRETDIEKIFDYFIRVDGKFSPFKPQSEISKINRREINPTDYSPGMKEIFSLAEQTKNQSRGYFDISHKGKIDPSGLVKGWAVYQASGLLKQTGFKNFYVEAGGDIQAYGQNKDGQSWRAGIRNPFKPKEIIKVVELNNAGLATSGTYERDQHIYNPFSDSLIIEIVSITVLGPNVYEADRFATAAFAMGKDGITFIEQLDGLEGYVVDKDGVATMTSGFEKYTAGY